MSKGNIERLVSARVAGLSLKETAAVCGVSVSTVQRQLQLASVKEAIAERMGQQASEDAEVWSQLRREAVQVFRESLKSGDERLRLRAAEKVTDRADRADVMGEFARRQAAVNETLLLWLADHSEDDQ